MKKPNYRYKSDNEIEDFAKRLREFLGYSPDEPINPVDAIERWQARNEKLQVKILPQAYLGRNHATASWPRRLMQFEESVWAAARRNDRRHRFTVAEEIGHMALQHPEQMNRSIHAEARAKVRPDIKKMEEEAGKFASYFLVPSSGATGKSPAEIQITFGVSRSVAEIAQERIERDARRSSGNIRPLPPRSASALLDSAVKGRSKLNLEELKAQAAGYLPDPCQRCGNRTLKSQGSLVYCECGWPPDSDGELR